VLESDRIGQDWDDDVRVVLFVVLATGCELDDDLRANPRKIRDRRLAAPRAGEDRRRRRHPAHQVSGKIVELAVRERGARRGGEEHRALANPEALDLFAGLEELKG
jgi:acetoacetyl-CoA synthetase